ncbi:peptidoglycan-binding domain-containing protein [Streptomyces krungchingensis]
MGPNDPEPQQAPGYGPDIAQEIQHSFQAVFDALDAARADLYAGDERLEHAGVPSPPGALHGGPVTDAGLAVSAPVPVAVPTPVPVAVPAPVPTPPPALPPRPRMRPLRNVPAPDEGRSHGAPPRPEEPPRTAAPGQHRARRDGVVEQLWLRGPRPEAAPVPPEGRPTEPRHAGPAHAAKRGLGWRGLVHRREARAAGVFGVGAVSGLVLASSFLVGNHPVPQEGSPPAERLHQPVPDTPDPSLPEIPGTGVLRQGDSGHGVYELQVRLLQIPNVYDGGAIDGRYGTEVREAVARFQEWYGIRGDETGVYGDETRHALMLRTT